MSASESRSGCALVLGAFLIALGALLLAANLSPLPLGRLSLEALRWFSIYWPATLVIWGLYKLYVRWTDPARARVRGAEIGLLVLVLLLGATMTLFRGFLHYLPPELDVDALVDLVGAPTRLGPFHRFTEESSFPLLPGTSLTVRELRGAVVVNGWDENQLRVRVTARVYGKSEDQARALAKRVSPSLENVGQRAVRLGISDLSGLPSVEADVELWVPRATSLSLSEIRGPVRVARTEAAVTIDSAREDVSVEDVVGAVDVRGHYGAIRIARVRGNVKAASEHGRLVIEEIEGDLSATASHDALLVERIRGSAHLANRYGRIRVRDIGRDLMVSGTHTEVLVEDVAGDAVIETTYRHVLVHGVSGRARVRDRNAGVDVSHVAGGVEIDNVYQTVTGFHLGGPVRVVAPQCSVRLDDVAGDVHVESSYHPVEIHGFRSRLDVKAEHASVILSAAALEGPVRAQTRYGDVELAIPPSSAFRLSALARVGEVRSGIAPTKGGAQVEEIGSRWQVSFGENGPEIILETEYGDILIREK